MAKNESDIAFIDFLANERKKHPEISTNLNELLVSIAKSCQAIAGMLAKGALGGMLGDHEPIDTSGVNIQGEVQKKLDVMSNDTFIKMNEGGGNLAGMVSEEMEHPWPIPERHRRGRYLLSFDPLDGSSNIDVNVSVGSIFSILQAPEKADKIVAQDFLQPGSKQVAAGYAIYGPSTILVVTTGHGVHSFTMDPNTGEFFLSNANMTIPEGSAEFAINASNSRFWQSPIRRYIDECLAGKSGPRDKDFNMRWIGSLVAEAHRILTRGGVFLYPRDNKKPAKAGRLRLLYEASPISFLIEQAKGKASTGHEPILSVHPESLHQRIAFIFGSANEVERIEQYHKEST